MLFGEYHHSFDPQNRVSVPAPMRTVLGDTFVIVRDIRFEPCLRIYPEFVWKEYTDKVKATMDTIEFEWFCDNFYTELMRVSPDSLGRVRISKELLKVIEIDPESGSEPRNVVISGSGDFGRIWSEENYARHKAEKKEMDLSRALKARGL